MNMMVIFIMIMEKMSTESDMTASTCQIFLLYNTFRWSMKKFGVVNLTLTSKMAKCDLRWRDEKVTQNDKEPSWGIWSNTQFGYVFWLTLHGVHRMYFYSIKCSNRSAEQRSCYCGSPRCECVGRTATENRCSGSDFKLTRGFTCGTLYTKQCSAKLRRKQRSSGGDLSRFHSVQWHG